MRSLQSVGNALSIRASSVPAAVAVQQACSPIAGTLEFVFREQRAFISKGERNCVTGSSGLNERGKGGHWKEYSPTTVGDTEVPVSWSTGGTSTRSAKQIPACRRVHGGKHEERTGWELRSYKGTGAPWFTAITRAGVPGLPTRGGAWASGQNRKTRKNAHRGPAGLSQSTPMEKELGC
ncbi:hypothetical protein KM043_016679 [Ampulex compressa]|nr:hypothetical protein KM043_016679 [Ampulex compressa]